MANSKTIPEYLTEKVNETFWLVVWIFGYMLCRLISTCTIHPYKTWCFLCLPSIKLWPSLDERLMLAGEESHCWHRDRMHSFCATALKIKIWTIVKIQSNADYMSFRSFIWASSATFFRCRSFLKITFLMHAHGVLCESNAWTLRQQYISIILFSQPQLSHVMRKPVYAICEQQRRRSACASPLFAITEICRP